MNRVSHTHRRAHLHEVKADSKGHPAAGSAHPVKHPEPSTGAGDTVQLSDHAERALHASGEAAPPAEAPAVQAQADAPSVTADRPNAPTDAPQAANCVAAGIEVDKTGAPAEAAGPQDVEGSAGIELAVLEPERTVDASSLPADAPATLRDNVERAREFRDQPYAARLAWFYAQVRNGGPMDYKQKLATMDPKPDEKTCRQLEKLGNLNYGAVGNALGISEDELRRMAGRAQVHATTSRPEFGQPGDLGGIGGSGNFGDDPQDQQDIRTGIQESQRYLAGTPSVLGERSGWDRTRDVINTTRRAVDPLYNVAVSGQMAEETITTLAHPTHWPTTKPSDNKLQTEQRLATLDQASREREPLARQMIAARTRWDRTLDVDALGRDAIDKARGGDPLAARSLLEQLPPVERQQVALRMGQALQHDEFERLGSTPEGNHMLRAVREPLARDYLNRDFDYMTADEARVVQRIDAAGQDGEPARRAEWDRREQSATPRPVGGRQPAAA